MEEKKTSMIRLRMSSQDAHYGGNLIDVEQLRGRFHLAILLLMKKLQVDPSADPFATAPVLESDNEH